MGQLSTSLAEILALFAEISARRVTRLSHISIIRINHRKQASARRLVMPVKYKCILIIIFGIYTPSNPENACSIPSRKALTFFETGPGLGLIMYILTTLEFPKHNLDFHLFIVNRNFIYFIY